MDSLAAARGMGYAGAMTYVDLRLKLPEELARKAEEAGLLEPAELERLLRAEIRRTAFQQIAESAERVHEAGIPEMSLAEIVAEVKAVRREMREARQ